MRLDADDKEVLALWSLRFAGAGLAIVGTALVLGLAVRLFEIVSG